VYKDRGLHWWTRRDGRGEGKEGRLGLGIGAVLGGTGVAESLDHVRVYCVPRSLGNLPVPKNEVADSDNILAKEMRCTVGMIVSWKLVWKRGEVTLPL